MQSLITILGRVPDPRTGNAQRHELLDVLAIALVASICGCQTCVDMASLAMVASTVERDGRITTATRYYLSSARLTPERFADAVRAHWRIENSLHWVLDTAFDEDRARTRKDHRPENLATIRKLALNVLKHARPDLSIRRKRNRARWSDAFARTIIAQMR